MWTSLLWEKILYMQPVSYTHLDVYKRQRLDDGDAHTCPQAISFSVCCKWFRWSVLPQAGTLEAEIFRGKDLKCCEVCGGVFVPKSNRAKYCPGCAARVHRRQKTESERKRRSCVDS